jgi:hypothetical protein
VAAWTAAGITSRESIVGIVTRRIGLSLGADICWAKAYEDILARLDLTVPVGRDKVRFEVERTSIVPFHLRREPRYDVVVDRLTHWFPLQREWIKKCSPWRSTRRTAR